MPFSEESVLEEVFVIETSKVDFFGAIVRQGASRTVQGRVRFPDGQGYYFHSEPGERKLLRERMDLLCTQIAIRYDAGVMKLQFGRNMPVDAFMEILREGRKTARVLLN